MKKLNLVIAGVLLLGSLISFSQVDQFPYLCSFETGPDGSDIVGTEPNWSGSGQWEYDDYKEKTGVFCASASINTTGVNTRNLIVNFNASSETGIKPTLWYRSTNQNIEMQIVGAVDGGDWVVLKDWFVPVAGVWTQITDAELSNLGIFNNEANCDFGVRAVEASGTATLRIDDVQITSDNSDLWKMDAASSDWNIAANWNSGSVPASSTDVLIPFESTNFPSISTANATCNNLNIAPGAQLTLETSYTLNVAGDLTVESTSNGTGSLLSKGTLSVSGMKIFQRYIEAYTGPADGWHLISSPVGAFGVANSDFEPGNNDDLYRWDEPNYIWENWKENNFDFANGLGYLVAYATSESREFNGIFNHADITFNNLSVTDGFGWHLLGNPFPCALTWGDGNWSLSNIEGVAKVYDESGGNYIDVNANGIIPAGQGFFVGANNTPNSITIPEASRTHDATAFYKGSGSDAYLSLKVSGGQNDFYDINRIAFNPEATAAYDWEYDGHKMLGQEEAPQMYMYCEPDEWLSTNTLPDYHSLELDLYFAAGTEGQHQIIGEEIVGFGENIRIMLEDTFEEEMIDLRSDSVYAFTANTDDPTQRFIIYFWDVTGEQEIYTHAAKVFGSDGLIYIQRKKGINDPVMVRIHDLTGRQLYSSSHTGKEIIIRQQLDTGIYLVSVNNHTSKVFITK